MDAAKIHTTLNYLPLALTVLGLLSLVLGAWQHSLRIRGAGFACFCLAALITLAVYATGEIAGKGSEIMIGPVWDNIRAHRASALPSFVAIEIAGVFALFGLMTMARKKEVARWTLAAVVLFAIAAFGLSLRTTLLGREIFVVAPATVKLAAPPENTDSMNFTNNDMENRSWHA